MTTPRYPIWQRATLAARGRGTSFGPAAPRVCPYLVGVAGRVTIASYVGRGHPSGRNRRSLRSKRLSTARASREKVLMVEMTIRGSRVTWI